MTTTSIDQTAYHVKPNTGGPCAICGATAKNLRARHRALKAMELGQYGRGVEYVKEIVVAFGQDTTTIAIK